MVDDDHDDEPLTIGNGAIRVLTPRFSAPC